MPYDPHLARRLKAILKSRNDIVDLNMFGGVGFLLRGNMCVGVYKDYLILRLGAEQAAEALTQKHVKPFDITGRPMKGWVMVHKDGVASKPSLNKWINLAIVFVNQLPRK